MKKVISEILKIDNSADLNKVIFAVKAQQKAIKAMEVAKKKVIFSAGQKVKINSRDQVMNGVIQKVNRTKAIVLIGDTRYNVPLTIMEAA